MKKLYIWMFLFLPFLGSAQTIRDSIRINEDYSGLLFPEFVKQVETQYQIQFFYFPGWFSDLTVRQTTSPTNLREILDATFTGSDYYYLIQANGQVIFTSGNPIQTELRFREPGEDVPVTVSQDTSAFSRTSSNLGLQDFEEAWVVIGDPNAPEQRPKVYLQGILTDGSTGKPLNQAIIYVEELKTGTTTDSLGQYRLELPQGSYQLIFQSIGLKESTRRLKIFADGRLDIELQELILELEELVVRADRKEGVRNVQMGVEAIKTEMIKELPTLLGEVDLVRSALMLPGVQSTGEFSSGINVRGGGADQNLILLNGAPVFNASHLFGFSSSFSPDVVDGFELYKSSIPAKFGGRISSVLDIQMKEGNAEKWTFRGGISPVTSRITAEGPLNRERSSLIVSGRATYSNWILKRLENAAFRNSTANYYDFTTRYKTRLKNNDRLDISGYLSNDAFQLNGDTTYAYQNRNLAAHYQHAFSQKLYGNFSAVYSNYRFKVDSKQIPTNSFDLSYQIDYANGKAHFSYAPNDQHQINFGLDLTNYWLQPGAIEPNRSESVVLAREVEPEKALEGGIYFSDEWTLSDAWSVYAGLRYTRYFFLGPQSVNNYLTGAPRIDQNITGTTDYGKGAVVQGYGGPEWRFSTRFALDENNAIKAAVNRNRQYLSMLFNSATVSPTATWKLSDPHIRPQTGDQFSIGYFRNMLDDRLEFSVESYYKRLLDMVEYKAGANLLLNDQLETDLVNGKGKAYGVELMLKKNGRKLNGWLSYTYSRTWFRTESLFAEEQINQGDWFPSNFDKPHDFSMVGFYRVSRRLSISTNVVYSSGRPITVPVAKYIFSNGVRLHYSRRNEFRVPDYFRWDFSMNIEGNHKTKKLAHSSLSISAYNITGRRNAYSIYFTSDGRDAQGYQLSIFGRPFLTLTYNFRF